MYRSTVGGIDLRMVQNMQKKRSVVHRVLYTRTEATEEEFVW